VLFDASEEEYAGDPDLIYYERFRGHALHQTPESTRPEVSVRADEEGVALVCDGGLPHLRWVLRDGLKVRLGRLAYRGVLIRVASEQVRSRVGTSVVATGHCASYASSIHPSLSSYSIR
jgi:hypothetical protein